MHIPEISRTRTIALCCVVAAMMDFFMHSGGYGAGKRASIVFRDSTKVIADVVSVQDSTLIVVNMRYDARRKSTAHLPDTSLLSLASITKVTLIGNAHTLQGAGVGALLGGVVGAILGDDAARNSVGDPVGTPLLRVAGRVGGFFLGALGGFFVGLAVGGNIVSDRYEIDPSVPAQLEVLKKQINSAGGEAVRIYQGYDAKAVTSNMSEHYALDLM